MSWDSKQFYKDNKSSISASRRKRYAEDVEFRRKCQERACQYYDENVRRETPVDPRVVVGARGEVYSSIGKLAVLIGRSVMTIRGYHRSGVFPQPLFWSRSGWRLYTSGQMRLLRKVFLAFDAGELKSLAEVRALLERSWENGEEKRIAA